MLWNRSILLKVSWAHYSPPIPIHIILYPSLSHFIAHISFSNVLIHSTKYSNFSPWETGARDTEIGYIAGIHFRISIRASAHTHTPRDFSISS